MLANIASIEIPALPQSLVEWLNECSDRSLQRFGIARTDINDRAFYPRLVLGEYLAEQFLALVEQGRSAGVTIDVRTLTTVADVRIVGDKLELTVSASRAGSTTCLFDYVILATGHQWPADPEMRPGYFTSPWPASALSRIRNCAVGMRGTSLSAIDAAVVLANQHGDFVEGDEGELRYAAQAGTDNFAVTLFSRKAILPEADFFHPIPYLPLTTCTPEAMERLVATSPPDNLLDAAFKLFRSELALTDPSYAQSIHLNERTLDDFCSAYFEERAHADPFKWARRNLAEASSNFTKQHTIPWRYAILRMHEVIELIVPHLTDADFERFSELLKPVFTDNYATVPHESIRRLLALHDAGKLSIGKLGENARLDTRSQTNGASVRYGNVERHFPAFVEATGQRLLKAKDFPFPSLRRQGLIRDVTSDTGSGVNRGIALDEEFHPATSFETSSRLFCLSLPYLLGDHPFAQGITSSAEMAETVASALESAEAAEALRRR